MIEKSSPLPSGTMSPQLASVRQTPPTSEYDYAQPGAPMKYQIARLKTDGGYSISMPSQPGFWSFGFVGHRRTSAD